MFHAICGDRITLFNGNKTAKRNLSEFNHGLVFSKDPLRPNYLFEVRIEKKVYAWSGGLEIGVTKCSPDCLDGVPANATDLKSGTWILSGSSVLKDGRSVLDIYGLNLNNIEEGDVVGVMKTDQNELIFSLNGECKGIAAYHIPFRVFAIVDLYGQVAQASVVSYSSVESIQTSSLSNDLDTFDDSDITEGNSLLSNLVSNFDLQTISLCGRIEETLSPGQNSNVPPDRIRFHSRCGTLAKISGNGRSAERLRPLDEFNNGVVITHRPLCTEELFEIRIDVLVEKWSGSIEVGVTMHNPDFLEFPPTMTNLKTGTIMMSGCGILTNGKATKRDYGDFNLDELMVGDRIGLIRKHNGDIHYLINGLDQGVAASNVPELFWGVVDLYGRTVKVTIVDRDEREERNLITRRINIIRNGQSLQSFNDGSEEESDCLMFHPKCGAHVAVTNNNHTAFRPNALEDFNNGVVLTHRPLKVNEPFEVKLDKIVSKWAGSIEIGVTSHSPNDLEFPSTMTNIRSGTWMMTGNGVMHNGTTVLDDYGINLDRLQVGDRVAIVVKENGSLHLFVNGIDQGEVPAKITCPMYGVIDLYGQAAQATIIEYDLLCCCSTPSDVGFPFPSSQVDSRFHDVHGKNIRICNRGKTAVRLHSLTEFTNAVVVCNRAIKDNEMFAIIIEKIVDRWSGSIEAGVTSMKLDDPDQLPATMTDLDHDTWMLSGSTVMKDGVTIKHGYSLNLDTVQVGMTLGMMRHSDGSLHFYLDGVDQGEACSHIPDGVYPVIDLYGQCVQVSIVNSTEQTPVISSNENWAEEVIQSVPLNTSLFYKLDHCFNLYCGKNIVLSEDNTVATRSASYNYGIVFSNFPLEADKLYEMKITKWSASFAGSLSVGVTTVQPKKITLPPTISCLKPDVWYLTGDEVWHNGRIIKSHYCHDLHWLQYGCTIGIRVSTDRTLHFYINGQDQGVAACDMPTVVYAVVDLYGNVKEITMNRDVKDLKVSCHIPSADATDCGLSPVGSNPPDALTSSKDILRLDDLKAERAQMEFCLLKNIEKEKSTSIISSEITLAKEWKFFRELRGKNVKFLNNFKTAMRMESYNQGVVIVSKPLERNILFQVTIDNLNQRWVSSLMIGILCSPLTRSTLPVTAFGFKKGVWLIAGDSVYHNGQKIKSRFGLNLEQLTVSQKVGIMVDSDDQLILFIDEQEQGVAAQNIPPVCYVILDLYGQCEQITIASNDPVQEPEAEVDDTAIIIPDVITENVPSETVSSGLVAFEKADLERHEKESPSDDDSLETPIASADSKTAEKSSTSSLKLHKTHENNAMIASSSHSIQSLVSQTESHLKLDKTNENNAVIGSCSSAISKSSEFHSKTDKTNENNSVMGGSMTEFQTGSLTSSLCAGNSQDDSELAAVDKKSVSVTENFALQQNAENAKHVSSMNCDHKTNLNIANTMFIQAEKSSNKSKSTSRNNVSSPLNDRPVTLIKLNPNCEYRNRCCGFRNFLGLPAGFFSSDSSITCYCQNCCPIVTQEMKGDPPSSYSVPNGWCKFPLKKHLMTNNVDTLTLEKWHVAFVGVSIGNVRRILDSGQLLAPDKLMIGYSFEKQSKLKDDDNCKFQIVLSPMLKYATNVKFASEYQYLDQKTKNLYTCAAAFQVLVRPGSYKVGPPTSKITSKSLDPTFNVNTVEWVIKEKESTVLSAVLLKMDPS